MPRGTLCRCPKFSLCAVQSSPEPAFMSPSRLGLPRHSAPSLQFREFSGLCPRPPQLHTCQLPSWARTFTQGRCSKHPRDDFVCLPPLRDHCSLLPDVQCLPTYSMYFAHLGGVSAVPFCLKPGFEHQMGFVSPANFRETQRILEFDPMLQAEIPFTPESPPHDPRMCESPLCFLNAKTGGGWSSV